jgi:hypothetical protein
MAVLLQISGRVVVMGDACNEEGAPSCCRVMARGGAAWATSGGWRRQATRHSNNSSNSNYNGDRQPQHQRERGG